jgi:DNA-binding response OmpR family regulator
MSLDVSMLVVADDPAIAELLVAALEQRGARVAVAEDGRHGMRILHELRPALVVLDLDVGGALGGWDVLGRLREVSDTPVLVLSASGEEASKVRAFEAGADDYVTKPFGSGELWARAQALLRRAPVDSAQADVYDDGRIEIRFATREVHVGRQPVSLTPLEFRVLAALVRHRGQVLSPTALLEAAWDHPGTVGPDRVKFAILRLRRKLGAHVEGNLGIEAVRGFGYRYVPPSP